MGVLIFHTLNEKQKEDILKLIAACNEYDGLKRQPGLSEEDNCEKELKSYFCYYEDNSLLSTLIIYQPFPGEAQITAYTLPSYRRQGYFKALFSKAKKELKKFGIYHAAFVAEYQSTDGRYAALSLGAELERSDYLMAYHYGQEKGTEFKAPDGFLVTDLTNEKLKDGIYVFQKVFGWEEEQIEELMIETLDSSCCRTYLGYIKGKIAGTLSVQYDNNTASIFGFGILKKYRGKGYGKYFLSFVLAALKEKGITKVLLQVESESREAFELYKKAGFDILEEYDYYCKNI
ncbi:GNAT family N-acetyltransferase [Anaerocolumna xylanovorans]|nr:GNAT family N-acetyltransferase [Anaerocolumna xylanovorans]